MEDWIDFSNFSVEGGCLSLVLKDFVAHVHDLAVYVKVELPFAHYVICPLQMQIISSFDNCPQFCVQFLLFKVFSILTSANVFVFQDFNFQHKDCSTYSGGSEGPVDFCYSFSISNDIAQIGNSSTQMSICDSLRLVFWIYFYLLTLIFVHQWLTFIGKFWSCCCFSLDWLFFRLSRGFPFLLHSFWLFFCLLGWSLWPYEMFHGKTSLSWVLLLQLSNFIN